MSSAGAAPRAAVPISSARAEASRKNGANSRGPKTEEGKARSARNALKHGMRAEKHVVLPDEDAAEFAGLEAALFAELAPMGALQAVLARRIAVAAWRLARADRIEAELFEERHVPGGGVGLALIRDGNGTRSFETLLRYRGAAMAEFWRALRTLKVLQAEQQATAMAASPPRPKIARRVTPNEPERGAARRLEYVPSEPAARGRTLHEPAAPWLPNEPEPGRDRRENPGLVFAAGGRAASAFERAQQPRTPLSAREEQERRLASPIRTRHPRTGAWRSWEGAKGPARAMPGGLTGVV